MTHSYLGLNLGYACDIESTQVNYLGRYAYSGSGYRTGVCAIYVIWGPSRGWLDTDDGQHGMSWVTLTHSCNPT